MICRREALTNLEAPLRTLKGSGRKAQGVRGYPTIQ